MAMDFTAKEAKQLINRHRELLSDLDYIASKAESINVDVMRSANDIVMQTALRRAIVNDCNYPTDSPTKIAEVGQLICNLYKYQKGRSAIETAKTFQYYSAENVRQNITMLNPGLANLSWIFGGKRAKEKASLAYKELNSLLNENYGQIVPHLVSDIDATGHISMDTAREAFVTSPSLFFDTLELLCPNVLYSHENNPFQPQLNRLSDLEQKISKCQVVSNKEKEQIKIAAEKMMVFNALQILKSVPVEEINREKTGFRVKALRDAGITTMADIYSVSNYQLASVHGVSDRAAFTMKRIATDFLKEAQEGIKIKLSADQRSTQATELIKAIYIYRLKSTCRKELDYLVYNKQSSLTYAKNVLQAIGNGLPWLFYTSEQHANVRDAYINVKNAIEGEYAETIEKLANILILNRCNLTSKAVWDDFLEHNIDYISILEEIVPNALGTDDILYGLPEELAREIHEEAIFPDGLLCTLRRYQEWGVKYILHQKKVLLGDEMGLGKTVQAIATMVSLRNTGATHFMVVCPASVVTNWCREIAKHSKLHSTKIHGADKGPALKSWIKTGGVAVTTFETTAHIKVDKLDLLIVDEAHYIKNPETARSINVKSICDKTERLLFMTGTALENKVEEMVSLIDILQPNIAESVKNMTFMPNAPQFRNRVAPVYYRRKREDVLTELPELIEKKEWCTLNPDEKGIYERNVLSKNFAASRRLSWDADDLHKSSKAIRLLEIIEQSKAEDRKVLVFSFFLDTIRVIGDLLGSRCYGPINGSVPPLRRQDIIDEFDKAPAGTVLLAQIQSGGTGLNIQSASVVVICEPQLKPSVENQAISRAYRMGQAHNVIVHRLLCTNTIDEKLTDLLEYKQEIFDAFADKSVAAEQNESNDIEVDNKTFGQMIQEEIDRINAEKSNPSF